MKVTLIGTGEAGDQKRTNTSVLIETNCERGAKSILIDCGYNVPYALRRKKPRGWAPTSIVFTHYHGDHFQGLPALLVPLADEAAGMGGRPHKRRINIASPHGDISQRVIRQVNEHNPTMYHNLRNMGLLLGFCDVRHGKKIAGLDVKVAESDHSVQNFAYVFSDGEKSVGISGDGTLTQATMDLFQGVDLLIHEAYALTDPNPGHETVENLLKYAAEVHIPQIALVHMNRYERTKTNELMKARLKFPLDHGKDRVVHEPSDGDRYTL